MSDVLVQKLGKVENNLIDQLGSIVESMDLYSSSLGQNMHFDPKERFSFQNLNDELSVAHENIQKGGVIFNKAYVEIDRLRKELVDCINDLPDYISEQPVSEFVQRSNKEFIKNEVNSVIDELSHRVEEFH